MSGEVVSWNRQPTTSTRWRPVTSGVTFSAACAVPVTGPASAAVTSAPAAPARTNLLSVGSKGSRPGFGGGEDGGKLRPRQGRVHMASDGSAQVI